MPYIHSPKLTTEPNNFIKIGNITINKNPNLLTKQTTPSASGRYGLWSTLSVPPTEVPLLPVSLAGEVSITQI